MKRVSTWGILDDYCLYLILLSSDTMKGQNKIGGKNGRKRGEEIIKQSRIEISKPNLKEGNILTGT